ncbi:hypothetical protein [Streptomyces sp. NPDC002785]|uniref:hypothetical protein n=1 Tax=Streptomyces sp. NPDC002785 TaxID=3154543 RepID=UPI00332E5FF7
MSSRTGGHFRRVTGARGRPMHGPSWWRPRAPQSGERLGFCVVAHQGAYTDLLGRPAERLGDDGITQVGQD